MSRFGLGLILAVLARPATAAEPLSLEAAIRLALDHSPRIEAVRARTEAAAAEATASGRARWPRLGVEIGAHRSNDPVMVFGDLLHQGRFTSGDLGVFDPAAGSFDLSGLNRPDPVNAFRAGVSIVQPIWAGGGMTARASIARAEARAAASREIWSTQEIVYRTEEAFRAALLAGEQLDLLRESLALAGTQAARVESLWTVGLALQSDRQTLNAHYQETAAHLVAAEADSLEARSLLGWIVGVGEPVEGPLQAPDDSDGPPLPPDSGSGVDTRGDVIAAAEDLRAAKAGVASARSGVLPALDLTAGAAHHAETVFGDGEEHWFLGLEARWSLDAGTPSRVQAAGAQARAAEQLARETREQAAHQLRVAIVRRDALVRRVAALEAAVSASRTAYDLVRERHEEGLATALELTEAQNTLTRTSLEAAAARHDLALARSAIRLAGGALEIPEEQP